MSTSLLCLISFLLFLLWERIAVFRAQKRVPLRIAVTGTRGKTSVARILASVLKEAGYRVVVKTTGSQALIILPDGSQIELDRSVTPSILEQKQVIRRASGLKADCLVAEVMSLRPENHFVESHLLLRPNLVVITNVRRDHTELMGETASKIASVLSLDICRGSKVFLPASEDNPSFQAEAHRCEAALMPVVKGLSARSLQSIHDSSGLEFSDNLDLVCAVVHHLGVVSEHIIAGVRNAQYDIGMLKVWRYHPPVSACPKYLVNAFAANDPESTLQVLDKIESLVPEAAGQIVGIFNLRADRLPRTLQWISVMREGAMKRFRRLYLVGDHTAAVRRRLPEARVIKFCSPEPITDTICSEATVPEVVFGFGNIKGPGKLLAEYWSRIGEPLCTRKRENMT